MDAERSATAAANSVLLRMYRWLLHGGGLVTLGVKWDVGKARLSKLPWREIEDVAKVLMFGAAPKEKGGRGYSWDNWQHVASEPFDGEPNGRLRYLDAALRHIRKAAAGEVTDPESGDWKLPHLGCAVACCLFVMWFDTEEANRKPAASE